MKLLWAKCPCLHPRCDRQHPTNLGTFTVGTGFSPAEREILDQTFALAELAGGSRRSAQFLEITNA